MFCGFGAVVLLVLILNHDTVSARNAIFTDLRAEALMLEQEVLVGTKDLVEIRNSLTATERELVITQGESEQILQALHMAVNESSSKQISGTGGIYGC